MRHLFFEPCYTPMLVSILFGACRVSWSIKPIRQASLFSQLFGHRHAGQENRGTSVIIVHLWSDGSCDMFPVGVGVLVVWYTALSLLVNW